MNPADLESVRHAISQQEDTLGQHSLALHEITTALRSLTTSLTTVQAQLSAPAVSPPPPAVQEAASLQEPKVPTPDKYDGDLGGCRSFLMQCDLVFDLQPYSYASDKAKIAFVIELLRGRALEWASALWERQDPCLASYRAFSAKMRELFEHPVRGKDASKRLCSLRQGSRSVAEYVIDFRTLAVEAGWNEESLQAVFHQGLSEQIKDELISYPEPSDLDKLVALSIRIDNRCRERGGERRERFSNHSPRRQPSKSGNGAELGSRATFQWTKEEQRSSDSEPRQVGRHGLSVEERQHRRESDRCFYCGKRNHYISCPQRPLNSQAR